jgi:arginine deiminase
MVDIPASIMTHYKKLILGGDIMFVNKIPFFVTISRHIKFGTVEMLRNQKAKTILVAIKQVKSIYMQRGFQLNHMLIDGQFELLRANLADLKITLNTVSADEHVPEIEGAYVPVKNKLAVVITCSSLGKCLHE